MHFLSSVLGSVAQNSIPQEMPKHPQITKPASKVDSVPSFNISINLPNFKGYSPKATAKKIPTPRKKSKRRPKPEASESLTGDVTVSEAISGLCSLGFKKRTATNTVKSLCDKKKYDSVESLIKDCFMCIH